MEKIISNIVPHQFRPATSKKHPNLYLYCFKNCICLAHNTSGKERRGIQHLQITRNVCRTVNQLRKRGWQDNPASSAMSLQGMCEVGAGQDQVPMTKSPTGGTQAGF